MQNMVFDGRLLKKCREDAGITSQLQLANIVDTSQKQISLLESGRTKCPRDETLAKLADAIGCRISDFFVPRVNPPVALPSNASLQPGDAPYPQDLFARMVIEWGKHLQTASMEEKAQLVDAILNFLQGDRRVLDTQSWLNGSTRITCDLEAVSAYALSRWINEERMLEYGVVSAELIVFGRSNVWTCNHHVGPTVQEVTSDVLGWDVTDIDPRDSFYLLGADEEEAIDIIARISKARGIFDGLQVVEKFVAKRYGLEDYKSEWEFDEDDQEEQVPLLAIPLGDVCEAIHREERTR